MPDDPEYNEENATQGEDEGGGSFFTNRLGPLPVWGWLAVLVGAAGLWWFLHRNSASSTVPGTLLVGNNAGGPSDIGVGTGTTPTTSSTNADWVSQAYQYLVNSLGYTTTDVTNALQAYGAGQPLNQQEYNIVENAINGIGAPPIPGTGP